MTFPFTKSAVCAASLLLASALRAEIKLNDNLSVNGYLAGTYQYTRLGGNGESYDSLFDASKSPPSADVAKVMMTANFKPVTGSISLYYTPNYPTQELTVLDAYVTYDVGDGLTVTGGKFLSWMGYEAFDTSNMTQITYGSPTVGYLFSIPVYHTGLKVEYNKADQGVGFAVVDSVYPPRIFSRGDGELRRNAGFEGYYVFRGVQKLTVWTGFAYDMKGGFQTHSAFLLDLWAQYDITKQDSVAFEITRKDGGPAQRGHDWLVFYSRAFTDKFTTIFRISGEQLKKESRAAALAAGTSEYLQYTIGPSYKLTDNLTVRADVSYYEYKDTPNKTFFGVQALFKF